MTPAELDVSTLHTLAIKLSADADWLDKASLTGFPLIAQDCREAANVITLIERDRAARNAIDPITRMHNLCDAMAEQRNESPYTQEAWDLQDDAYREKCVELKHAEADAAALRQEVERLRADAERLTDMLLVRGAMDQAPCFICGYNGRGYWSPSTHQCVLRRDIVLSHSAALGADHD